MSQSSDQNDVRMQDQPHKKGQEDDLYKIGTVAKLTGIAVERLRAWERRYGLTPASREGKTRYFSGQQVERLTRIKRLIDQGHPVSTLINLDDDALNERLQLNIDQHKTQQAEQASEPGAMDSHPTRVGLVGTQLLMLEQTLSQAPRIDVVSRWVNLPLALTELATVSANKIAEESAQLPDVVVVLLGSLTPQSLNDLNELPENMLPVVIYHYATESALAAASEQELQLLRWPARWEDIEIAVARQAKSPLRAGRVTARRFSDEQLLSIACASADGGAGLGHAVGFGCACPADLVNLISALNAFSDHSQACSASAETAPQTNEPLQADKAHAVPGRARPKPADARQKHLRHAQIAQRTSEARLELELVLEDWVLAEGLLPVPN